jgi:hypothetical protein
MDTFCDPETESWEWHEADTWHSSEPKKKFDRRDLVRIAVAGHGRADIQDSIAVQFERLVSSWKDETENLSSFTKIVQNSSYQQIIRLGKNNPPLVLRMILQELKQNGGYWATALQAIAGENPVKPEHIGNQKRVGGDWLDWGKQHGYV